MVRVKICGITNSADALAAIDAGANFLGFNFYDKSPRFITEAEAAKIRPQLPKKVQAVGIFVNAPTGDVAALCKSLKLDAAQLHGDEPPEIVAELSRNLTVWKAFRVEPDFRLQTLNQYPEAFGGGAHCAPVCGGCCQRRGIKAGKERSRPAPGVY